MTNYDFKVLAPYEFQNLIRDLLQKEFRIRLESFKEGRDGGVDLRYQDKNSKIIIQCKRRMINAKKLLTELKKYELPKVNKIKPTRYIIAASVGMSPNDKEKIAKTFHPFCKGTQDIFGLDDINDLLSKYPDIEKQHIKLWLSGTPMLEKLLHAGIFNITDSTVTSIKNELAKTVVHEGVDKARTILHENNHVIILGIPGIGKTTVANFLLAEYIKKDYEPIIVTSNISEAWEVITSELQDKNLKKIIYYDDFLGQTSLETKFGKNEEISLIKLINTLRNSPNIKLIMTTRDYILKQAMSIYERINDNVPKWAKSHVLLEHYTKKHKALILYHHLYFSDLPNSYLVKFMEQKAHHLIIEHGNFNPRIIEILCKNIIASDKNKKNYIIKNIKEKLDEPMEVWKHPFENQLNDKTRTMLLVLASLFSTHANIKDIDKICQSLDSSWGEMDLARCLNKTEGTFTMSGKSEIVYQKSKQKKAEIFIRLHNPSIKDFLLTWITDYTEFLQKLYSNTITFDQALNLLTQEGSKGNLLFRNALLPLDNYIVEKSWSLLNSNKNKLEIYNEFNWERSLTLLVAAIQKLNEPKIFEYLLEKIREQFEKSEELVLQGNPFNKWYNNDWIFEYWETLWLSTKHDKVNRRKLKTYLNNWLDEISNKIKSTSEIVIFAKIWKFFSEKLNINYSKKVVTEEQLLQKFEDKIDKIEYDGDIDYIIDASMTASFDIEELSNYIDYSDLDFDKAKLKDRIDEIYESACEEKRRNENTNYEDKLELLDKNDTIDIDKLFANLTDGRQF